jgi:hypothetical protein
MRLRSLLFDEAFQQATFDFFVFALSLLLLRAQFAHVYHIMMLVYDLTIRYRVKAPNTFANTLYSFRYSPQCAPHLCT